MKMLPNKYQELRAKLKNEPKVWLVTGVAGFIGSNLLQELLELDQCVIGLDNFVTGKRKNLIDVRNSCTQEQWRRFNFVEGDICKLATCQRLCDGVDHVLHQAALGSVPRSINDPISSNAANVTGFLNMLVASKDAQVSSFTYASSSATYGDHPRLPKVEECIGQPLSPYGVTKYINELYASVFATNYKFYTKGLRYFNVFGRRQDPNGSYSAVIPKWISAIINGQDVVINGDGHTSRDFSYVGNIIQANLLAATSKTVLRSEVYNVAVGENTSLNELYVLLCKLLGESGIHVRSSKIHEDFRPGDILHSHANILKASTELGYAPQFKIEQGLRKTIPWYLDNVE